MQRIEDEYVSFESAKMLKKAGFNWYTKNHYSAKGDFRYSDNRKDWNAVEYLGLYSAPTLSFAARWLREVCNTHISIDWGIDGYEFTFEIKHADGLFSERPYYECYPTYEECLEEGIKAVLENL